MTIRDLEIFLAVAESGSMSRAAEKLYITQPAVSLAISALESEFQVRLFERLGRKPRLTNTGKGLVRHAKHLLSSHQTTLDYLNEEAENHHIRIGATATIGSNLISKIVIDLNKNFPTLQHEVIVANTHIVEEQLLVGQIDIALVEGRIHSPDIVTSAVLQDSLVLICSPKHPFFGRSSVSIRELHNQPMILREKGSGTRAQIEEQFRLHDVTCNAIWDCHQFSAIIDAVRHGLGVSILSERLVQQERISGTLWTCTLEDAELSRTFNLSYHKDKHFTEQMERFAQLCLTADCD